MLKRMKVVVLGAAILAVASIAGATLFGDLLTDLIKIGGVGLVVDRFGPDMNKAINKIQNFSDSEERMTKVVPILSIGAGKFIGAAQVMGPRSLVNKVKAVAQLETNFMSVRLKALVPVESKDVVKNIKRVIGVGVSGIIDLKI